MLAVDHSTRRVAQVEHAEAGEELVDRRRPWGAAHRLHEIEGVDEATAREAMRLAAQKLPIKTKFVSRREQEGGAV